MEITLKEIIAVSGYSGLFKFVSQGRNGIIVESLTDGKRTSIPVTAKVSALADIAVYTDTTELPLREVLKLIEKKENGGPSINPKTDSKAIRSYFAEVVPDFDRERVYTSDIKKVITWYNILQQQNLLELLNQDEEEAASDSAADSSGDDS